MYTYKLFTIFIFMLLTIPNIVLANECQDLKDDLITSHHEYQKSNLKNCDGSSRFCCNPNNEGSCDSVYQAQLDYNNALATVNILEGLTAISMSAQNNHNAIKNLKPKDLDSAVNSIDAFLQNVEKASLIHDSLNFVKTGDGDKTANFWDGYGLDSNEDNIEYTKRFIQSKCADGSVFKSFCEKIKDANEKSNIDLDDIYKDLHGFAVSDFNSDPNVKAQNYPNYQKYLNVKIDQRGDTKTLHQFLNEDKKDDETQMSKILKLKDLIIDHKRNPSSDKAKKIVKLSNELEQLNMNFNENISLRDNNTFSNYVKNHFSKDLSQISSMAGITTGKKQLQDNLEKNKNSMDIELKEKEKYLVKKMEPLKRGLTERCSSINSYSLIDSCLKNICGVEYPSSCKTSGNEDLKRLGLEQIINDTKAYKQAKNLEEINEQILGCLKDDDYKKDEPLTNQQQQCMLKVKNDNEHIISDSISVARAKLKKAKENLDFINKGQPVNNLLAKKLLAIKALGTKNCIKENDKLSVDSMVSICNTPEINSHTKKALKLTEDVGQVLITYDLQEYNEFLTSSGTFSGGTRSSYSKMVDECRRNPNASDVCKTIVGHETKLRDQKIEEQRRQRQRQQRLLEQGSYQNSRYQVYKRVKRPPLEDDGPSGFAYAMGGLARGVVTGIPSFFGYLQGKRQHEMTMQYYDSYLQRQQLLYGPGAIHHTYNMQIDYTDLYNQQHSFNPANFQFYNPTNNLSYLKPIPMSYAP